MCTASAHARARTHQKNVHASTHMPCRPTFSSRPPPLGPDISTHTYILHAHAQHNQTSTCPTAWLKCRTAFASAALAMLASWCLYLACLQVLPFCSLTGALTCSLTNAATLLPYRCAASYHLACVQVLSPIILHVYRRPHLACP